MYRNRILLIDSDPVTRRFIKSNLEARDYEILTAVEGREALTIIERELPDLAIVNLVLRDMDGPEICRRVRFWSQMPIIIFCTQQDCKNEIECLNAGADGFLPGPFEAEALVAHIKALLRRAGKIKEGFRQPSLNTGDIEIKFNERRVMVANREIQLTPTEYSLLQELALNPDKVLTHSVLLNKVWGPEYGQEREYLRVFVGRLRKKLEADPQKPSCIVTVPWVGYKLKLTSRKQNYN